jgi:hypothetical protein
MPPSEIERVDLPSGETLWYVDEDHSYWRHNPKTGKRGTRLTGVTTICKVLDFDPSRLLRWAAQTQCRGIAELVGPILLGEGEIESLAWLANHESIWRELERAELDFEHIRDQAGEEGTNVHVLAFQALAMGRPVPDLDALSAVERAKAQAVMAFWLDHDPEPEQVEQIVYSERGRISRCDDEWCGCQEVDVDEPGVIDLKTGKHLFSAAHEQVGGGYPLLAKESGFGESVWALFLKVTDDGDYDLIPARGTPEGFEISVSAYREAGRISRESSKDFKARQKREAVAA